MKVIVKHLPGKHSQKKHGKGGTEVQMTPELEELENAMWANMPQVAHNEVMINMQPMRDWERYPGKAFEQILHHTTTNPDIEAVWDEKTSKLAGVVADFNNYNPDRNQKPVVAMEPLGQTHYFDGFTEAMVFLAEQVRAKG